MLLCITTLWLTLRGQTVQETNGLAHGVKITTKSSIGRVHVTSQYSKKTCFFTVESSHVETG